MIILNKLNLAFGEQILFDEVSCTINKESRIGLVGRNGSGKSTLLKVIAGLQDIDDGTISIQKGAKIGYMPQEVVLQSDKTILEETFSVFDRMTDLLRESDELEKKLQSSHVDPEIVERYAQARSELDEFDVAQAQVKAKKILVGLGFAQERFDEPVSALSVGWRMRVVLAKLLLSEADFYLFDEPTNHLDIVTKDWFLHFLRQSGVGFILVCHDRYFLDHLCEKILDLDRGKATIYHANFEKYLEQKESRLKELEAAALRQQKELARKMRTVERFRASATKAKMAQSMLKKIEKTERIEMSHGQRDVSISFPEIERSGRFVLKVENLSHLFGEKKVFENVSFEVERGERVAIVAPNGVGKTTLFNIVTGKLDLQSGHISFGYKVLPGFFEQDQDKVLCADNTILQEVESVCKDSQTRMLVRKMLGAFLFPGDDVKKKIRVLSGGEKNRVAMVKVLLSHANVLLLDEPTNHLDIQSKEILVNALKQFGGTILLVSHDRDFLDKLATRIIELSSKGIVSYPGNYESYVYHKEKSEIDRVEKERSSGKSPSANKAQYELRKKIGRIERKIDALEKKIKKSNDKLAKLLYDTCEFSKVYDALLADQKELETLVAEWEELQDF